MGKGTGLGLSLVYSIVKSNRGFLSVYSEPGAGSTFEIYLPVVDDEEVLRKLAKEILEMCGYTVLTAADGEEAVKLFRAFAERIDLVLLDMMMPVMSGRKAFLELRRIKPQVKVLLSSGFRADTRVQELIDGGVAGFLDKPYTLRSLAQAVGEILAGGSRA